MNNNQQLELAAKAGDNDEISRLLGEGVSQEGKNNALQEAARAGHPTTAQLLILAGADPHAEKDYALAIACWQNHTETVRMITRMGNYEGNPKRGHITCRAMICLNEPEKVKSLVESGLADKEADDGLLLRVACNTQNAKMVKLLLDLGTDPSGNYNHALGIASEKGDIEMAKILLEAGAEITARRHRAVKWAEDAGQFPMVAFLLQHYKTENLKEVSKDPKIRILAENELCRRQKAQAQSIRQSGEEIEP